MFLHPDRAASGTAAAVRLAERLVQVVVHRIESHQAGVGLAEDGVEVGPVVVHLAAGGVHDGRRLGDVRLEHSEGARIGDHHGAGVVAHDRSERVEVEAAVGTAGNLHDGASAHGGAGGIGSVGGVGDDHLGTLRFTKGAMILLDAADGGELTLGTGDGLQRHLVHP